MKKQYTVGKHPLYGYTQLAPKPSREELSGFYRREFYARNTSHSTYGDENRREADHQFNHGHFADLLDIAETMAGPLKGKALLDYGCGFGELLLYAQSRGLDVAGVEVSPEAVDFLKRKGISAVLSDVDTNIETLFNGRKFQVITLLTVLEHLSEPADTLRSIREHLLAPDGVLIVEVPNEFNDFQLAAEATHNLDKWYVSYPGHINYFNSSSLKDLLEACGYVVEDAIASFPMEIFLLMGDVYIGDSEVGRQCHARRMSFEKSLRTSGHAGTLRGMYRKFAELSLGRTITCFSRPDPYTTPTPPKKVG